MLGVLVVANFRWLWIGQAASVLGSQFYLIALTGILIEVHTLGLFLGAGSLMTVIGFLVAIRPEVRSMGLMEKQRSRPGPMRPARPHGKGELRAWTTNGCSGRSNSYSRSMRSRASSGSPTISTG
jgi:hypothetical protein